MATAKQAVKSFYPKASTVLVDGGWIVFEDAQSSNGTTLGNRRGTRVAAWEDARKAIGA